MYFLMFLVSISPIILMLIFFFRWQAQEDRKSPEQKAAEAKKQAMEDLHYPPVLRHTKGPADHF